MTTKAAARLCYWTAVVILCLPPAVIEIRGAQGLEWPDDPDFFRDTAQAQSFADGHLLSDPHYLGEWFWYNPLVPALVAGLSHVTGHPVHRVYAQAGAYLNLLAPVLLAALVARCFGHAAGFAAVSAFLYLAPQRRTGIGALYSSLLYNANLTQALFYLALLAYVALPARSLRRHALTGLLLGLTFLGHTAPFLVLSLLFVVELARDAAQDARGALRRYGLLFAVAAIAASPLLVSVVGRYQCEVRNAAPMQWSSLPWPTLRKLIDLQTWAAGAAFVVLWLRGPRAGAWLMTGWVAAALALLGQSFAAEAGGGPAIVPRHHLLFYARVAQMVLLGYGASALWAEARRWIERAGLRRPGPVAMRESVRWAAAAGGSLLLLFAVVPGYARRGHHMRTGIIEPDTVRASLDAYRWMRSALDSTDVVLSTDERALLVTGPAGAKTVALECLYANPYVDCEPRRQARDEMLAALRRGDEGRFEELADRYAVTHVLWVRADGPWLDARPFEGLALAFDNGRVRIHRRVARRPPDARQP